MPVARRAEAKAMFVGKEGKVVVRGKTEQGESRLRRERGEIKECAGMGSRGIKYERCGAFRVTWSHVGKRVE